MVSMIRQALEERRKKSVVTVQGVPVPLSPEVDYRKQLLGLIDTMNKQMEDQIFPLLTYYQPKYIQDTPRQDVLQQVDHITNSLTKPVENFAERAARLFVTDVSNTNRKRLYNSFQKSFGFNMSVLIKDEGIVKPVNDAIKENIGLIKSIPTEYMLRARKIISAGMTRGETAGDIRNQLRDEVFQLTDRRARLIARDQTTKINGQLTQIRAQDAGCEEYIWIGRNDALERASHKANNNKKFRWDKEPETGHPGADYQCRCYAKLIIKF